MRLISFILYFFILQTAYAQFPKTEFSKKAPSLNEPFLIKYTIKGDSQKGEISSSDNFATIGSLYSSHVSVGNNKTTSYSFILVAKKSGKLKVPQLTYLQDKKTKKIKAVKIVIDKNKILPSDSAAIFDSLQPKPFIFKPIKKDDFDSSKTEIKIDYPQTAVKRGEQFTVEYRTNDKEYKDWKQVAISPNIIVVSGPELNTSMTVVNGVITKFSSFTYTFKIMDKGTYVIPGAILSSEKKKTQANSITIHVE